MPISPETLRSRSIRETILRALRVADAAGAGIGYSEAQLVRAFETSVHRFGPDAVLPEVRDLVEDGLVRGERREGDPDVRYTLTSRGRDFCRANFPWGRIDEYTGAEGPV